MPKKIILKRILIFLPVIVFLGLSFYSRHSHAEVTNSQDINTIIQSTTAHNTVIENKNNKDENDKKNQAKSWGLTQNEWQKYQVLMQGKDGHWYPQLSPPEILGLEAQTLQVQQHFAKIVAQQEHDKVARELAFDHSVHTALLQLYPSEPLINPFDFSPFNPVKGP